jgi:hypothetical protein
VSTHGDSADPCRSILENAGYDVRTLEGFEQMLIARPN